MSGRQPQLLIILLLIFILTVICTSKALFVSMVTAAFRKPQMNGFEQGAGHPAARGREGKPRGVQSPASECCPPSLVPLCAPCVAGLSAVGWERELCFTLGVHVAPVCAGYGCMCWQPRVEQDKVSDPLELTFSWCGGGDIKTLNKTSIEEFQVQRRCFVIHVVLHSN